MESDDRQLRLRANFGYMMVWAALTIGVFGRLLGIVLASVAAADGLTQSYLPPALPDASTGHK